jgi:hypothetical protein
LTVRKHIVVDMLWMIPLVVVIIIVYLIYRDWRDDWYRKMIPAEVELGRVVVIDGDAGLREGCGFAVFEISAKMKERILVSGLGALTRARPQTESVNQYGVWRASPYIEAGDGLSMEDRWIVGLNCGRMNPNLRTTIDTALHQHRAFYTKFYESAVIVIPSAGIVAYVYNG